MRTPLYTHISVTPTYLSCLMIDFYFLSLIVGEWGHLQECFHLVRLCLELTLLPSWHLEGLHLVKKAGHQIQKIQPCPVDGEKFSPLLYCLPSSKEGSRAAGTLVNSE